MDFGDVCWKLLVLFVNFAENEAESKKILGGGSEKMKQNPRKSLGGGVGKPQEKLRKSLGVG